jgi:hypothetical protein
MKTSYEEKSIWINLVTTLLIFGGYFFLAFQVFSSAVVPDFLLIGLFVVTIVLYTIVQIILQSVLAVAHVKEAEAGGDERDNLIELKATRISYFILVFGIWVAGFSMFQFNSALVMANIIMFFFILAESVAYVLQLRYHRRGI